jgi:hypothetical protein
MTTTLLLAVLGLLLLIVLSVCTGISLDTDRQRRERQRLAEERRLRAEERRWTLHQPEQTLCDRCPYRYLAG